MSKMASTPTPNTGKVSTTCLSSRIHGGVIAPGMTKPGTSHRRQKRMGPAPFASFEDLSDELDSPEDKNSTNVVRLPGIREDATPCSPAPSAGPGEIRAEFIYTGISLIGASTQSTVASYTSTSPIIGELKSTLTPRIDISRASSSSHHDSKDSTPEKEETVHIGIEEAEVELRTTTEEMEFSATINSSKIKSKSLSQKLPLVAPSSQPPPSSHVYSPHHEQQLHEDSYHSHNRKDSQSSELGLLCISGRTSRLSSIGSQSSAHSRVSNASHLSVVSGTSRSPSPHKMLLETSFCGTKPKRGQLSIELFEGKDLDEGTKELERALLQRVQDPTQVLIAEGVDITPQSPKSLTRSPVAYEPEVNVCKKSNVQSVDQQTSVLINKVDLQTESALNSKPKSRPLDMVTIKIDKAASIGDTTDDIQRPKLPKHIVSDSGTEFIYIPLKGPLPDDAPEYKENTISKTSNGMHTKVRETKSASGLNTKESKEKEKRKSKSASPSPAMTRHSQPSGYSHAHRASADEPKYIRIRLKPDHLYEDFDPNASNADVPIADAHKPDSLNLQSKFDEIKMSAGQSQQTHKSRYHMHDSPKNKSPSPALSRKSSFASLFKSREAISPESPTPAGKKVHSKDTGNRRSRSKSRDRSAGGGGRSSTESIDSKGRSMFSLFSKSRKGSSRQSLDRSPGPDLPNLENLAQNIQNTSKSKRTYESPLQGESIRIPLHSPTYYESKNYFESFKTSSQDSQETVIEVKTHSKCKDEEEENANASIRSGAIHQSSTSSENIVFSTKLGSNNDIFSTKLPKHQEIIETTTAIVEYVKERVTSDDEDFFKSRDKRISSIKTEETFEKLELDNAYKNREEQKHEEPKLTSSASSDSRKFRLEKSRCIESNEQLSLVTTTVNINNLSQSITSSSYIPKVDLDHISKNPVEFNDISPISNNTSTFAPKNVLNEDNVFRRSFEDISMFSKEMLKPMPSKKSEENYSSESERETEFEQRGQPRHEGLLQEMEPERKGLVLQQDSYEDELPYIPTTLPQERSMAVPIIPIKQRSCMDVKTCTIERPRSTTPIKPTLEVYHDSNKGSRVVRAEKLKISLPRQDEGQPKIKSPRQIISFDGACSAPITKEPNRFPCRKTDYASASISSVEEPPPPLPPKGMQKEWINFEEIPEKRKAPKRIQTIPSRGNIEVPESLMPAQENVIYTYVNPEDCKCECHDRPVRQTPALPPKFDQKQEERSKAEYCHQHKKDVSVEKQDDEEIQEDEMPLLDDDDDEKDKEADGSKTDQTTCAASIELSTTSHAHYEPANGTSRAVVDMDVSSSNSNRSIIISQVTPATTPTPKNISKKFSTSGGKRSSRK